MRTLLVTGPGGSGRTTLAAATAWEASLAGTRTLVLSADRGDSLGVALGVSTGDKPLAVGEFLTAWRPDASLGFREDLLRFQEKATGALDLLGASRLEAEEMTSLPGAEELNLLRALRDAVLSERFELVVVDLPALPQALSLLALPEELRRYIRRLLPAERQAARALRPVLGRLAGVPMPAEWLYEAAGKWDGELAAVEAVLADPRTGVRLVGPKPRWSRTDGGEAGLHPSNIHDTPYSVGAVDYTGDMPVLLGPDGPSLGGFVCPATIHSAERWKLGQLRPGDTVRFTPVDTTGAARADIVDGGILARDGDVTYRRSGDDNLLVEFGPLELDLALRMRVHALMEAVTRAAIDGVTDLTPGIRSLQIKTDPDRLPLSELLPLTRELTSSLPPTAQLTVPSRTIHLPLSWDDPATREAIARYMAGVRDDAPWCPWNIEFIRRVNGLATPDDVHRTVFDAEYLVLGLGDVYLGAPVATPLDPRHRLVTTKYNPARTWTAENSVGIGGAYLCVYGMEGPGGYQFVGRTTQVWSPWQQRGAFEPGKPWLLRFFDRIKWYPVDADELLGLRADITSGRFAPRVEEGTFSLAEYETFLAEHADSIAEFRRTQQQAFTAERQAWEDAGEFARAEAADAPPPPPARIEIPPGGRLVEAEFAASVWQLNVRQGDEVTTGQPLLALEAMKMESRVDAPTSGIVHEILTRPGDQVEAGTALLILAPAVN
nr:carboxyltransferase domain-containing protein [Streptomyces niveiscabiei]